MEIRGCYLLLFKPFKKHGISLLSGKNVESTFVGMKCSKPVSTVSSISRTVPFVMRLPAKAVWAHSMRDLTYTFPITTNQVSPPFPRLIFPSESCYSKFLALLPTYPFFQSPIVPRQRVTHMSLPLIGHGATSQVRKLGYAHAVKLIPKAYALDAQDHLQQVIDERNIMAELKDTHYILNLTAAYQSETHCALVTELAGLGNLENLIARLPDRKVSEAVAKQLFAEVVLALVAVHRHGVLFRDLKLRDIFMASAGRVRLGDFGMAKLVGVHKENNSCQECGACTKCTEGCAGSPTKGGCIEGEDEGGFRNVEMTSVLGKASSFVGNRRYISPELCKAGFTDGKRCEGYGTPSDVWALGVVLYILLTGRYPFRGPLGNERDDPDSIALLRCIRNTDVDAPDDISEDGKDLIRKILTRDPLLRITLDGIRDHPWLHGMDWVQLRNDSSSENSSFLQELSNGRGNTILEIRGHEKKLRDECLKEEENTEIGTTMDHIIGFEI